MAQTRYTREDITTFVKNLDVRARELSDAKIDDVINRAYAELMTVSKRLFSNEEVVSLQDYYDLGEDKITLDVTDDCKEVYDLYTTIETEPYVGAQEVIQGVGIYRNNDVAYRDNRAIGRVHVNLKAVDYTFDNVVIKYYYTPKATDQDVFMESQVYLAFQDAIWASLNYFLKDVESESQKRASMYRTAMSSTQDPEDIPDSPRAMFGGL